MALTSLLDNRQRFHAVARDNDRQPLFVTQQETQQSLAHGDMATANYSAALRFL
jgi:hypothetical protein